jgi:hypothetical protein
MKPESSYFHIDEDIAGLGHLHVVLNQFRPMVSFRQLHLSPFVNTGDLNLN